MNSPVCGTWHVISNEAEFRELQHDWERLFSANPKHRPFQAWSWTDAWLKNLAGPHELHIICLRDHSSELQFLLPLVRSSGNERGSRTRLHNLCGYGPDCSDHVSTLRLPALDSNVAGIAAAGIAETCGAAGRIELGNLDDTEDFTLNLVDEIRHSRPIVRREKFAACPVVKLPGTWEDFLQVLSSNFRSQVRRFRKRIDSGENTRCRSLDPAEAEAFTHDLIRLNRSRMGHKGQVSSLEDPAFRGFLIDAIPAMARSGLAWMDVVEKDGQTVGAALNLLHGQSIFYYMGGFDDSVKNLRPGTALFARAIERGIENGYTSYDFLRGAEPYKYKWGATDVHTYHLTIYPPGFVSGQLASRIDRLRDTGRSLVRRMRALANRESA